MTNKKNKYFIKDLLLNAYSLGIFNCKLSSFCPERKAIEENWPERLMRLFEDYPPLQETLYIYPFWYISKHVSRKFHKKILLVENIQ